ncbi:MAG: hypothetical protein AAF657_01635 [Acidobacteriota bacterium]
MASRLVVLRQRLAKSIHSAFAGFGQIVTDAINERIQPFLDEGEVTFDFPQLQRVLARMSEESFERMVAADKAHFDELTNDIAPRLVRDQSVEAVRRKLIEVRQIIQGLFGAERTVEIVAIDGQTALQPERLWRQGEHTLSRLRSPDLRIPEASTRGFAFDPTRLADELEPIVRTLRDAIDAVELERQLAATSLREKQEAMAEHDALMSACGRILAGFYLLARRPDLARRIKLSLPRAGRSGVENGADSPSETEPGVTASGVSLSGAIAPGDTVPVETVPEDPLSVTPDAEPAAESGGAPADVP